MLQPGRKSFELPPTAGLPLLYGDFRRKPAQPFASSLADWLGLPEPVLTCSGTAALVIALRTLRQNNPQRNEVIIPAYTCPLVGLAPRLAPGLRVVPCDTVPGGFDFDPRVLKALCNERTLAVIPTHLGGRVADVEASKEVAVRCGAAVIEDAAQGIGALSAGRSVGLAGDIGFFSLAVGKGLTTYEGGVLFSKDQTLHAELRRNTEYLLRFSLFWSARRFFELLGYAFFYTPERLWLAYGRSLAKKLDRNDEVAAVGDDFELSDIPLHSLDTLRRRVAANAFERLPAYLETGRQRARTRVKALNTLPGCMVLEDRPGTEGVWPFMMLVMPGCQERDRALNILWREGLGVSKLFVHALPDYTFMSASLENGGDCSNARDFASRMLSISNTHWLDDEIFACIVQTLRSCL